MNYKFVIPSYQRYIKLKSLSLYYLDTQGIPKDKIYIFIRKDDADIHLYRLLELQGYHIIETQVKGIGKTHNAITEYFDEDEWIIELDDDLIDVVDKNRQSINSLTHELNMMIDVMEDMSINYGGFYQVANPMFMSQMNKYTFDLKYILGIFRIRRVKKDIILCTNYSEDFENAILHYLRDGKILKNNWLCGKTKNYAEGGCKGDGRNNVTEKKDKEYIANKYPELCTLFQRKSGIWDLRLKSLKKNNKITYKMMNIGDSVKINGGASKGCEGIITALKNVFVMVRLTQDKKGTPLFVDVSKKVKKCYVDIVEAPPIVMPSSENLKHVDFVEEEVSESIFETINSVLNNKEPLHYTNCIEEVEEIWQGELEPEHEPELTLDDYMNCKEDNEKLNYKIDSMMSFQVRACGEIADLKFADSKLRKRIRNADTLKEIKSILEEK
tara:strand:- start:1806 stop:3128 length:1323 start_codon:yes stop_codon:yes gene_type:complete